MVVPAGGAWLAVHVLLLLLLAAKPVLVSMAVTSPSSSSSSSSGLGHDGVSDDQHHHDNVTAADSWEEEHQQQQADMPVAEPYYRGQGMESGEAGGGSVLADGASLQDQFHIEDIQVGCRELRAKRYISDGFCTSTKPIKEVVCAGHCLPIRNLPWYAEFVKVWARSKLKEWQCEEDVVRRKTVSLLCRNGEYRTYRIKVVKSCKCKRLVPKHNRTVAGEGKGRKKKKGGGKRKRKKDRRRRGGRKNRKGERRNRKEEEGEEVEEKEEEEEEGGQEEGDGSHRDQRQDGGRERRGRKRNRKRAEEERNWAPVQGGDVPPAADSVTTAADSERHKALPDPTR